MNQPEAYERFRALHAQLFIMPNAWDGTSALLLKQAGFRALGTSSAAIAFALGRIDGTHAISRKEHLDHAQLLAGLTALPIIGDFEDGYGVTPEDVARTVVAAIQAGLAGIGIEDTSGDADKPIRDYDDAVARVAAAAKVARGRIVLTGRCDNFIQGRPDLDDTIRRLTAFAEAGADVLYAPYPADMAGVKAIVRAVAPKPVNLLIAPADGVVPLAELAAAGVKRVSLGSALYMKVMGGLRDVADRLAEGDLGASSGGVPFREVKAMVAAAAG
jgi:2-methylisocitrate lyase-like PEP mutase family enzyme